MEINSPPPCPNTVTVRRNPPRRARPTPYSAAPLSLPPPSSKTSSAIRSFPIDDILSIHIPQKHNSSSSPDQPANEPADDPSGSEKLKVFLRIRPLQKVGGVLKNGGAQKNVWPQNPKRKEASKTVKVTGKKKIETCLKVNDSRSVTLFAPQSLADARRTKSEVYEGFSHVFGDESSQSVVYEKMMSPLVVDFLKGKSGMLAAMGPSGSGKTHTVFGSARQPGMVSLALRRIFSPKESSTSNCLRTFYLSMFEIYSERGKGEKIMDLSQEGGDLYMQQSNIKGLKEEVIRDVQHAESLIASGMLKRSTAMTNSNIQSSRSQCIINIRCDLHNLDEDQLCTAVLTIVDLAGAEREKRTGNQGARLLESNFINNTSMVFGLCLRSLLEHQKNPKKPLHKHFQNSMLTKYLRDFLEGKKRMALILTAKPGEDDYQDTSYLLRQASPFMNIKFESIEEQPLGNKRRTQTLSKVDVAKRMKLNSNEVCMNDEVKDGILHQPHKEELIPEPNKEVETNGSSFEFSVNNKIKANKIKIISENITDSAKIVRENQILSNFSRALWKVLKEYKNKLEGSEKKSDMLRHTLNVEKERCAALETELNLLKVSCSCSKIPMVEENDEIHSNAQVSSSHFINTECNKQKAITIDTVTTSVTLLPDCSNTVNLENQVDEQVSCLSLCEEEQVDTMVVSSINCQDTSSGEVASTSLKVPNCRDTSPGEVASTSLNIQNFEEQSNKESNALCEYVVFDKEDLMELGDTELSNDIAGYNTLELDVTDSELPLHGDRAPFSLKENQRKHEEEESNAQDSSSDICESECFQKQDILENTVNIDHEIDSVEVISLSSDLEKFEEQSEEKVDVSSPVLMLDKQDFKETEERKTDGETTGCDSELHVQRTKDFSFVKGDQGQHDEDENAQFSLSSSSESRCFEKQDILDDAEISSVEVMSDPEKFEDQIMQKIAVPSPNLLCNIQESKGLEEGDADGEVTELHVHGTENSSFVKGDQGQHEEDSNAQFSASDSSGTLSFEKQDILDDAKIGVKSPNLVCDKQESKEVEERVADGDVTVAGEVSFSSVEVQRLQEENEVNVPVSSSHLEGSKSVGSIDSIEAPDQQLLLPEDIISSQSCKPSNLSVEPSVQPTQPLTAVKPKRRLRPASSVMLKNINILDFDDTTTLPKQQQLQRNGKRGENEDGSKRTQGSISLLRILKQNLHN
ncbi:hypothetical protein QVD17_41985 [Tagetes erecta]|uniref:Kinesin motor domain-containing protein n=1 Tax=Tagetes erecta TaxID=13708 RepID=A0AAD8JNB1_TARER|nr:hypothetical protein QVD17_41985 [Tagetes erecta]